MKDLDEKIILTIFGEDFQINENQSSPFRDGDGDPSLRLYYEEDRGYSFFDFGHGSVDSGRYDMIELLRLVLEKQEKKPVSRLQARSYASKELRKLKIEKTFKKSMKSGGIKTISNPTIECRNYMSQGQKTYWLKREQNLDNLVGLEGVLPVSKFYYHPKYPLIDSSDTPMFLYVLENGGWKYYNPYAKEKADKWKSGGLGGNGLGIIEGWNTLPPTGKVLWCDASSKDRFWMKLKYPNVINPLNEGNHSTLLRRVSELKERFEYCNVSFDADEAGIKNTKKLCAKDDFFRPVYLVNLPINPTTGKPCKDKDDIGLHYGSRELFNVVESNLK